VANRETKLQIVIDAQNRTQGTFNTLKNNLDAIGKSYEGVISSMKTAGAVGAVAFGGLSLATKQIVEAGAAFEQTQIAFETMLGSAETARQVLGDLARFAAKTPFEIRQLEEASKRLLAYGTTAEDLLPTLKMLGDISAGVGMDKLPQLILAFGQVQAATKLTGAELRQFSEAGVPLLGALADELGKTEAEIIEMVSDGAIGFETMKTALAGLSGEGGKFFNLMEKQSTSLSGQWSNLKDQIALTARVIGTELLPYLKPVVDKMIEITQAIRAFVEENPKLSAGILMVALAIAALSALLFPLAIMLPGLIILIGGLATAFGVVTAISAPMLLAIGGIITILTLLVKEGYTTGEAWSMVWLGIKVTAAGAANAVIETVESMVNFVIGGVNKAIEAINKVIKLAQKVPGLGKTFSTIGKIDTVTFDRFDTNTIAAEHLAGSRSAAAPGPSVQVYGNTFLDKDTAKHIGDLIIKDLQLQRAL
jgi:tape measure domain-containing protein